MRGRENVQFCRENHFIGKDFFCSLRLDILLDPKKLGGCLVCNSFKLLRSLTEASLIRPVVSSPVVFFWQAQL